MTASLRDVADSLRRLAVTITKDDVFTLNGLQVRALAALLEECRSTTDEGVLRRARDVAAALTTGGDPS